MYMCVPVFALCQAQLEKLQSEISSAARKTGIASAAKLATIHKKTSVADDDVPSVEWWDSVVLPPDATGYAEFIMTSKALEI